MRRQQGFTLMEILVAVLVLSLGVLGLVGLEGLSMQTNQEAYHRSQATLLAYELADRMRANPAANYATASAAIHGCVNYSGTATSCNNQQVADEDLSRWFDRLGTVLPYGTGSVAVSGAVVTISVLWDGNRNGSPDQSLAVSTQL